MFFKCFLTANYSFVFLCANEIDFSYRKYVETDEFWVLCISNLKINCKHLNITYVIILNIIINAILLYFYTTKYLIKHLFSKRMIYNKCKIYILTSSAL